VTAASSLPTGTYAMRITAVDTVGISKSSSVNIVVGLSSAASPTVSSAESSMTVGGVVHLSASVLSSATGTMAFKYGSTTISGCGTVAITSGTSTCDWTTSTTSGSPFSITAVYSGDGSYATSTSAAISMTVIAAGSFSYATQNKVFGEGASVTPTITGGAGNYTSWTIVNSTDSNSVVGIYINSSGVVSISNNLGVGNYLMNISANDSNGIAGSGTLQIFITQANSSMTLSVKTVDGQTLTGGTLGRQVRIVALFNVPVTGSVTISDARGSICSTFAFNGSAECWWGPSNATYSPYSLTATFAGNSTASTSNTLSNFAWNPAMSVVHADTSVETGRSASITPTVSGGTGAPSTWTWGIAQYFTGNSIGGITINSSGVISIAGSLKPDTYTMSVSSYDLAGANFTNYVVITVSEVISPSISISVPSETTTVGSAISGYTISNSGGSVSSYSIDHSLPSGLTFNPSTGAISGTPTETTTALIFTLSASNFGGIDTATYTLTITSSGGGGSATISIALTGGALVAAKGTAVNVIATISVSGKVKFLANGKPLAGCTALSGSSTVTCSWKPTVQGQNVALTAILNPNSNSYSIVKSAALNVGVGRRTGRR
jgi:hypothetical protein